MTAAEKQAEIERLEGLIAIAQAQPPVMKRPIAQSDGTFKDNPSFKTRDKLLAAYHRRLEEVQNTVTVEL